MLLRFRAAVAVGRIGGPKRQDGKIDLYHWVASSGGDVVRTFEALSPWLGAVKRAQFVEAVGPLVARDCAPTCDEELAWAAGLFDGDGSTCLLRHRTHEGYRTCEMSITQTSRAGMPEVLTRFRAIVGLGHLNGPSGGSDRWEPIYRWKAHRLAEIQSVADSLGPWLGSLKCAQASAVISTVGSQPVLPRGNPAWGSHKTHCVRGHEYASARMRPYRSRSGGTGPPRPSKQCLACVREQARRHRANKREARRSS